MSDESRPIADEEVDAQIQKLSGKAELQGKLRLGLLRYLIKLQREGHYRVPFSHQHPKPTGGQVLVQFYEYLAEEGQIDEPPEDAGGDGKHLVKDLRDALDRYYHGPGRHDEIVIAIPKGRGPAYEPSIQRRSVVGSVYHRSTMRDVDVMEALKKRPFHSYHLTRSRESGTPIWAYKVLNFRSGEKPDVLIAEAASLPKAGEDRRGFVYEYEASLDRGHLVLRTYRVDASDDITLQLYPRDGLGEQIYPWCGVAMLSRTWYNHPASTICILSDKPVPCASEALDGEPICDEVTVRQLQDEWEKWAARTGLRRLPPAGATVQGVTIFPNWDHFLGLLGTAARGSDSDQEDLRIATIAFSSGGAPEDKLLDLARSGVRVRILMTDPINGESLVAARNKLRVTKLGDRETPKAALDALNEQIQRLRERRESINELKRSGKCKGELDFRLSDVLPYGFVAHSNQFIILGLFIATGSYGAGPMIVLDPRVNRHLWETLRTEWEERWIDCKPLDDPHSLLGYSESRATVVHQIIGAIRLLKEVEAKVPDGADVWIASHDLSTVGDDSPFAELVRQIVRRNAGRGVNYTYVCPSGRAGSRLDTLRACFDHVSGKLKIHQVPPQNFSEILLIRSHFISFNPLEPSPKVYMQLPLSTPEKGWVEIDTQSAHRVLGKMKELIEHWPTD